MSYYDEWCKINYCDHGHCPEECEKPQPIYLWNGLFVCRKCLLYGIISKMIPCTPETCI